MYKESFWTEGAEQPSLVHETVLGCEGRRQERMERQDKPLIECTTAQRNPEKKHQYKKTALTQKHREKQHLQDI